ncbi:MAG: DUF4920 domain-containing protein [Chitinophagales bacterium]
MLQKKSLLLFFVAALLVGCNSSSSSPQAESSDAVQLVDNGVQHFGEKIDESGVMSLDDMLSKVSMGETGSMKIKTKAEVEAVCQVKGCWMTLKKPDGNTMRVTFKDYGFFMPKDIVGKTVIIEGEAKVDTTTVDDLRHYAEDEGLPREEIEKITEPEVDVTFIADGVILKNQ